jgi:hypothetical protein
MRALTIALILALSASWAVGVTADVGDKTRVRLPGGAQVLLEEIALHRNVTFNFYNQAMESIPAIEPGSRILVSRRDGQVGRNPVVFYSLVAYATPGSQAVKIAGAAEVDQRAWRFDLETPEQKLAETLLEVVEQLSMLPQLKNTP